MRIIPAVTFAAVLCLALPVSAQGFLTPLGEMFESLSPKPEAKPRATPQRPKPAPVATDVPLPQERPAAADAPEAPEAVENESAAPVPLPRPTPETRAPAAEEPVVPDAKPEAEPAPVAEAGDERVYQTACPAVLLGLVEAEANPPLVEDQCGERSPLTVTAVLANGRMVPLSTPLITNCAMASALPAWVSAVDGYATSALKSPLGEVVTGTSYMCRKRNNASEGFTSEHGFANAVDVTGFTLDDGRSIGVEGNWMPAGDPEGRLLRFAHDAGCTGFTTVLGPEANALHHDHLHLDLGCHGKSCTARICE